MTEKDAYTLLAERHGQGESKRYRQILEVLMTPFQAQLVAELPATPEDLAQKFQVSPDNVKKEIDDLFFKGVVIPKNFYTREGARFCRMVIQLHDATESDARADKSYGPELLAAWEDFCQKEWYPQLAREYSQLEQPVSRVIPAYRAVQNVPDLTPYDDVREIIKAASLIATVPCSCRRQSGKKGVIIESCLQFGRSAEYAIVRGSGRKLSVDEAMEVIDKTEEDGEIHTWPNARILNYGVMCNCVTDSCVLFLPLMKHGVPVGKRVAKSRFEAVADQELCDGCQECIDRCQFEAIEMVRPEGSRKYKAQVYPEKCWGCGLCVIKCEPRALSMRLVRPLEHIPDKPPERYF